MSWGNVAVGVGTVALGAINSKNQNKAQLDAVETPTRTSGIEKVLKELESATDETSSIEERQSQLETAKEFTDRTTTTGDARSQAALAELIEGGRGDGQAQVDAMVNKILREGKTGISNVGTRTGSFGSTTEQLLTNDLITKAAEAGVGTQLALDAQQLEAIKAAQAGTSTETGQVAGTRQSAGSTSSDAEKTTATTGSEGTTGISDTLQNPQDKVKLAGALADLVDQGINVGELRAGGSGVDLREGGGLSKGDVLPTYGGITYPSSGIGVNLPPTLGVGGVPGIDGLMQAHSVETAGNNAKTTPTVDTPADAGKGTTVDQGLVTVTPDSSLGDVDFDNVISQM